MTKPNDVDQNDMMPQSEDSPTKEVSEEAQKDAAEERLKEGGYNG